MSNQQKMLRYAELCFRAQTQELTPEEVDECRQIENELEMTRQQILQAVSDRFMSGGE